MAIKHITMVQQTAMQQLIKWMEERSRVIPFDQGDCYDKAIELLQMEKEQIISAHKEGNKYNGWALRHEHEKYYNETYKP